MSGNTKYEFKKFKIHYFNGEKTLFIEKQQTENNPSDNFFQNTINSETIIKKNRYNLIIGIAMYAEDYSLIDDTLEGISSNLPELNLAGIPNEKILVVIISDGRDKIDKDVYEKFTNNRLDNIEAGIDEQINSEIFSLPEYKDTKPNYLISCWLKRECINKFKTGNQQKIQMDVLFCIKKQNRGKLDSHFWLFMGFCKEIDPRHIILLDTGTIPDREGHSLSSLIIPMINDREIAGTCGEMELSNKESCTNFVLTAQFLEYKYAHVIDKNFESLFGFISVLPGAFSAYRWEALNNNETLQEYFKTIDEGNADCSTANRYLAEDRIFCFILFSLKNNSYILKYIPDAKAATDAPEIYGEFLLQRRRWINGSNFALYYVISIFSRIFKTKHRIRLIFIGLIFLFYVIQVILSYFILGTFYFVYYMICSKNFGPDAVATSIIMSVYLFIIIFCMITAFTMKPKREYRRDGNNRLTSVVYSRTLIYKILSFILGFYNVVAFTFGIYTIIKGGFQEPKILSMTPEEYLTFYKEYLGAIILGGIGFGNFMFPLLYEPSMIIVWVKNFVQYLFFQPTYAIILNVFSVCNIDDVSWGNRDSSSHINDDEFKKYKIKVLFVWLILNFIQGWGFSYIVTRTEYDKMLINYYSYLVACLSGFKLISGLLGKFKYIIVDKYYRKLMIVKNLKFESFVKSDIEINLYNQTESNENQHIINGEANNLNMNSKGKIEKTEGIINKEKGDIKKIEMEKIKEDLVQKNKVTELNEENFEDLDEDKIEDLQGDMNKDIHEGRETAEFQYKEVKRGVKIFPK